MKYKIGEWNLAELVKNPKNPDFEKQVKNVKKQVKEFQKIKPRLNSKISFRDFDKILSKIENISEKINVIGGFASLNYAADTQSDKATSLITQMSKLGADVSNQMLFFDLWWKQNIDKKNAQRLINESGNLRNYLVYMRLVSKYALSEPEERIINTLDVTGATALVKLYDKITNSFEYKVTIKNKKKTMSREELTSLIRSKNFKTRENAYKSLLTKFSSNRGVLGEIYQNIVLNWKDEGIEIRKYQSPISIRNIANDVDDQTISSLLQICKKNSYIFQKFFEVKARILNMKKLRRYDLYATLTSKVKEKKYSYDKSVKLVLDSLNRFNPKLSDYAKSVFDQDHVDSSIRLGKKDGAFCSTLTPHITPYVLVNFTGKSRDVFTLAHELGHAIHSMAAAKNSILVQNASLPLAETASTFSEMLLYDSLIEKINNEQRQIMMAEKIDDLYATIMRQSFFTIFEIDAHKQIADTTTIKELSKTYHHNLKEQFGRTVTISDDFEIEWTCIPHFYHTPFYCYSYSFGNLLALSLFQRFKKEGNDFVPTYMQILSAGGSKKPELLLADHGIDITSKKFWQDGFDYIKGQVNYLSKLG